MKELRGKVAVVTGGGSGIGRAMALSFAGEGMNIVLGDIDLAAAETVAGEVRALGCEARTMKLDVRDRDAVEALAELAFGEFGGAHVICNNAGVVTFRPAQEMSDADWEWVMGVDLDGVINGVKAFLPRLVKQGQEAHIVNTASIAGMTALPGISSYVASKFAVVGLSEHMQIDLAPLNIGVSVLCPDLVATRIFDAGRNRPAEFGGPETPPPTANGGNRPVNILPPEQVGALVLRAVKENQLYILTHPESRGGVERRLEAIRAAFA